MLKLLLKCFGSNSDRQPDSNFIRCNSTRLRTRFNASAIVIIDTRGYIYIYTRLVRIILRVFRCTRVCTRKVAVCGREDKLIGIILGSLSNFSAWKRRPIKERGVEKNGEGKKRRNRKGRQISVENFDSSEEKKRRKGKKKGTRFRLIR